VHFLRRSATGLRSGRAQVRASAHIVPANGGSALEDTRAPIALSDLARAEPGFGVGFSVLVFLFAHARAHLALSPSLPSLEEEFCKSIATLARGCTSVTALRTLTG